MFLPMSGKLPHMLPNIQEAKNRTQFNKPSQVSITLVDKEALQAQQQSLQNQLLTMESSTDGAVASAESKAQVEQQLKDISQQLRAQATSEVQESQPMEVSQSSLVIQQPIDTYDSLPQEPPSGIYQVVHDQEGNWMIEYEDPDALGVEEDPKLEQEVEGSEKVRVNAQAVESEVNRLQQKLSNLEQRYSSVKDVQTAKSLEAQMKQVIQELRYKNTASYGKAHAKVQTVPTLF